MNNYYCLIAGLPDITIEDTKQTTTVKAFRAELAEILSDADKKVIDLFYLQYDNANLYALLTNKEEGTFDDRGLYTPDQLEEIIRLAKEEENPSNAPYPDYLFQFTTAYLQEKKLFEYLSWEDQLAALYYEYAEKNKNRFVSEWFTMNRNINNMFAAITCRKYNQEASRVVVGTSEISETIRRSGQRDLGLNGMIDYLEQILRIADENNLYERERKLDLFRWKWLEEQTFFHYFSIERVFAYLIKLSILERWTHMNQEEGRARFKAIIDSLNKEVELPENF